jgi:hypothetical protein
LYVEDAVRRPFLDEAVGDFSIEVNILKAVPKLDELSKGTDREGASDV